MALDEPQENDQTFNEDGLTFIIDKELLERVKPLKVEFIETERGSGYYVSSSLPAGAACGTSCSSC
jgi:Fe-S cluster assembly iron-binding protein IscA